MTTNLNQGLVSPPEECIDKSYGVRKGQVYLDKDPRTNGRTVTVLEIFFHQKQAGRFKPRVYYAKCETIKIKASIECRRLTSGGYYKLIGDPENSY